jgi:hypothetical protein
MTNPLTLRLEGLLAYAAVLAVLALVIHWGIGPVDVERSAVVFVLGLLVPSLAVKQATIPTPPPSGDVSLLKDAEVKDPKNV